MNPSSIGIEILSFRVYARLCNFIGRSSPSTRSRVEKLFLLQALFWLFALGFLHVNFVGKVLFRFITTKTTYFNLFFWKAGCLKEIVNVYEEEMKAKNVSIDWKNSVLTIKIISNYTSEGANENKRKWKSPIVDSLIDWADQKEFSESIHNEEEENTVVDIIVSSFLGNEDTAREIRTKFFKFILKHLFCFVFGRF